MTDEQLRDYAAALIFDHAMDIEYLSIHEMAGLLAAGGEITDDDAATVDALIPEAVITITWPGSDTVYRSDVDEPTEVQS